MTDNSEFTDRSPPRPKARLSFLFSWVFAAILAALDSPCLHSESSRSFLTRCWLAIAVAALAMDWKWLSQRSWKRSRSSSSPKHMREEKKLGEIAIGYPHDPKHPRTRSQR